MNQQTFDSARYWEDRYRAGGNSGAGSFDALAAYKAGFINSFVASHVIASVVELGCGDGNQLSLAHYPSYIGLDVSETALDICRKRYAADGTKSFDLLPGSNAGDYYVPQAELALSLDVIYHLIEDPAYETYMRRLFSAASRYVIIYSSDGETAEARGAQHVRHRKFTDWITSEQPRWRLRTFVPNPFAFDPNRPTKTTFSDFYVFELGLPWRLLQASSRRLS